jgi:hypothetical protein
MVSHSIVLGYHGCDKSTANKVVNGASLNPSKNEWDWLGSGMYFWEDSYSRAREWALTSKEKIKEPAVLGAVIDLGNCLNLIDAEHIKFVRSAHESYLKFCKKSNMSPAQNKGKDLRARYLDKAVFEMLHKLREEKEIQPFDSVRAFFVEGEPLYDNCGLHALDHIQICVRNPDNIIGYFLPRVP